MAEDRVYIFDTTLRDGEQSPGATMNAEEKFEIAKQLERLGVDIIEAGFAANSQYELEAIQRIAANVRGPIVASLARVVPGDIDLAWEAVRGAASPRIHVFLSTSDIHLMHQLRRNREQVMEMAIGGVKRAKSYLSDVEFSPMDATRTEPAYLYELLEAVIQVGATTINIPDTVGYSTPEEFEALIRGVFANVPSVHKARVSVHCHNDLGLATPNSLAAVRAGARQVEVCVNGLGERAGNASLEEVVMGLHVRKDYFNVTTNISTNQIYRTSRLVSDLTGMPVQPNKAIVGANAFRHESGIHQDAMIKNRQTFEIMNPTDVGVPSSVLHLGKTSGRAGFRAHLKEMGYDLPEEDFTRTWDAFKDLVNKKKDVSDRDVEALIAEEIRVGAVEIFFQLEQLQVVCGEPGVPTASVRLRTPAGELVSESAIGDGPVDAVYKAISRIVNVPNELVEFSVQSITESTEAMGDVTIRIQSEGATFTGRAVSTDIIVASGRAYVNALNRLLAARARTSSKTVIQ